MRHKEDLYSLLDDLERDGEGEQTFDEILDDVNGDAWRSLFEKE